MEQKESKTKHFSKKLPCCELLLYGYCH